jgi:hypothetical protein
MKINWLPFQEAKRFVHKLNFKTVTEWLNYSKSRKRPFNIPSTPRRTYKNEWKGMSDWLGTGIIPTQKRVYRKYLDAQKFVHTLKLINRTAWTKYCKSGNKPNDIPNNPWHVYRNSGWKKKGAMGDWLGTGTLAPKDREFWPYKKARTFVHKLDLSGATAWRKYVKSDKLPDNIPSNPNNTYTKQGTWISWGDFLGTNSISVGIKSKSFLAPKEGIPLYRKLCKKYGINNGVDWKRFAKTHGKLLEELHLPSDVLVVYSEKNAVKRKNQK